MSACAEHRRFLVAIADGEAAAVPAGTLEHIRDCPDCAGELDLHRAAAVRLRQALQLPAAQPAPKRRAGRAGLAAGGAIAAALLAAAGIFALNVSRPDPVLAAARAGQQPAQFQSSDAGQIGTWCAEESGRPMPEMDLPPLRPVGARMDHQAGAGIVTVYYVSPDGRPLTIGWLDASVAPAGGRSVTSRLVDGRLVLVALSARGTAVISGQGPASLLWSTAAAVEESTAGN